MNPLDTPWEDFKFSICLPKVYFYLHDNCRFCSRFKTVVPFLSYTRLSPK